MKRLVVVALCALALVGGGLLGRSLAESAPGRGLTLRTGEGSFVAYVARNGRVLLASGDGWRYAELDPALAGSLVNTLATLSPSDAESGTDFEILLDGDDRRLTITNPRSDLPGDPLERTFVVTLWQLIDTAPTLPAVAPAIRVRLTALETEPRNALRLTDGLLDAGAALRPGGDRLTGDRLARLVVINSDPADGRGGGSFPIRIDGRFYTLTWSPDPAGNELAPAPTTAPSPSPTLP